MSGHTPASILDAADAELGPSCCDEDYQRLRTIMIEAPDLLEALDNLLGHAEQLEEFIESERGKGRSAEQLYAAGEMHNYMIEAKKAIARAKGEA